MTSTNSINNKDDYLTCEKWLLDFPIIYQYIIDVLNLECNNKNVFLKIDVVVIMLVW